MTALRKPNFFVVGAPKCGTTSLYDYLRQHDQVFMTALKEPHYFATDLHYRGYVRDHDAYARLYSSANNQLRLGEASVWYLYSERAAGNIRAEIGEAKIIAMLRNPVDFLHSLHNQLLISCSETITDFVEALDAETDRLAGLRLPRSEYDTKRLYYSRVVDFATQLERYFSAFGRDNVHIVFHEDFKRDTLGEYRRCLEFLDVDSTFRPELEVLNRSKRVHSRKLQSLLRRPKPVIRTAARSFVPTPIRHRLIRHLRRINTFEQPRAPIEPATRALLVERFRPQVERLSELLGRDLSDWLEPLQSLKAE
jgi:hypothetical protein